MFYLLKVLQHYHKTLPPTDDVEIQSRFDKRKFFQGKWKDVIIESNCNSYIKENIFIMEQWKVSIILSINKSLARNPQRLLFDKMFSYYQRR